MEKEAIQSMIESKGWQDFLEIVDEEKRKLMSDEMSIVTKDKDERVVGNRYIQIKIGLKAIDRILGRIKSYSSQSGKKKENYI